MTKFKPTYINASSSTRRRRYNRRSTRRNVRSNVTLSRINCMISKQLEILADRLTDDDDMATIKSYLRANALKILNMLENPDTIYVFGDGRHGESFFDLINGIWDCLSPRQKDLLENSHYFTETSSLFGKLHEKVDSEHLFPVDDRLGLNPPVGASLAVKESFGMKRISVLNNHWPEFIEENLTSIGLNIVALGRTHLYEYMCVPESAEPPLNVREHCSSFQDALAAALPEKTIKTFALVDIIDPTVTYDISDTGIIKPVKALPLIFLY